MSKLVITCMNGIGGVGNPTAGKNRYLSHVISELIESESKLSTAAAPIIDNSIVLWGKGDISRLNDKWIFESLTSNLNPGDVWLAYGFSYGVRDTCKRLIERLQKEYPETAQSIKIFLLTADGDYAGRVAQAVLPWGKRLRAQKRTAPPVHYHINLHLVDSFPGGMRFERNPETESFLQLEFEKIGHSQFDTSEPVRMHALNLMRYAAKAVK